jgi:ureidoacrylate peracid hydrolase
MVRFDITADKTALLIIDMQNAFLERGATLERAKGRDLIPRLNELIRACHEKGIPTIFTRHAFRHDRSDIGLFAQFAPEIYAAKPTLTDGAPDADIYPEVEQQKGDIMVPKRAYSAFEGTDLDLLLKIKGIDTLIIGGVDTVFCCESTARSARHRNYRVIFLSDGTETSDQPDMGWGAISARDVQRFVLTIMALRYAEVASVEDVLRRVQGLR